MRLLRFVIGEATRGHWRETKKPHGRTTYKLGFLPVPAFVYAWLWDRRTAR